MDRSTIGRGLGLGVALKPVGIVDLRRVGGFWGDPTLSVDWTKDMIAQKQNEWVFEALSLIPFLGLAWNIQSGTISLQRLPMTDPKSNIKTTRLSWMIILRRS
jgi:hypothetical protein